MKVYGQQQKETHALNSEAAYQMKLNGMNDSEILQSLGIETRLIITE